MLQLILGQGVRLVGVGLVLGLIGAYLLRGVMTTMVFGVQTLDPIAYVVACALLGVTTLVACVIPAGRRRGWIRWRRCGSIDPVRPS